MTNDYFKDLPTDDYIREGLTYVHDYWRERNRFISQIREILEGRNKIDAPTGTPYKIRTVHSYSLAAIVNEKASRFTQLPVIQVIPTDETREARNESSIKEQAINAAMEEMDRRSDGDVWTRAAVDAIILDEGVERIERAPAAFWSEVIQIDENGDVKLPFEQGPFDKELTVVAKKAAGLPIRSMYVPLENFFPIYEGPNIIESYEIELRSLRDVLRNPLFGNKDKLNGLAKDEKTSLRTQVSIVHYVNSIWHAYFAMAPSTTNNINQQFLWPDYTSTDLAVSGQPIFLYGYKHNLGMSMYNCISGRFGGWKTSRNRIEGISKGLLELNQVSDEILSQALTHIRASNWPTHLQTFDPEARGIDTGSAPSAVNIPEGQNFAMYIGEEMRPLVQPSDNPMLTWVYDKIQEQMSRLGGSPVIFGQQLPGVNTGYHQALQISQAEHIDEKIEQHLSVAATNRARIMLQHIKSMNLGEVYVHATEVTSNGKRSGKYLTIDPDDLIPMPRMDAQVRKPRPVDFAASVRAAREASDERQGKGPLMSDDTIRGEILNLTAPDQEEHKIRVERQTLKIWESGIMDAKIMEALNIKLATQDVPDDGGETPPALHAATQNLATPPAGNGASPNGVTQPAPSTAPMSPGQPIGQSQPEANAGKEIAGAIFGGASQ